LKRTKSNFHASKVVKEASKIVSKLTQSFIQPGKRMNFLVLIVLVEVVSCHSRQQGNLPKKSNSSVHLKNHKTRHKSLKRNFNVNCDVKKGGITFSGDELSVSDFAEDSRDDFLSLCKGVKDKKIQKLNILALKSVTIDAHFKSFGFDLSIVAPLWKVAEAEEPKISVFGVTGSLQEIEREPGDNGRPGAQGEIGNSFFGIAQSISGSEKLSFELIGGDGGPGEDGMIGKHGINGITYEPVIEDCYSSTRRSNVKRIGWNFLCSFFMIYGTDAGKSFDGGKGGEGGYGGIPGHFKMISEAEFIPTKKQGNRGSDGSGGERGPNGNNGEDRQFECWDFLGVVTEMKATFRCPRTKVPVPGKKGCDGCVKAVEAGGHSTPIYKPTVINQYKKFFLENLVKNHIDDDTFHFYFHISDVTQNSYQLNDFFDEFITLDNVLRDTKKEHLPFYNSILSRLEEADDIPLHSCLHQDQLHQRAARVYFHR
jgi:hypothetical protein